MLICVRIKDAQKQLARASLINKGVEYRFYPLNEAESLGTRLNQVALALSFYHLLKLAVHCIICGTLTTQWGTLIQIVKRSEI